ncbi:hypothetical protein D3C86_1090940 [compost metagenome]
MTTCEPGASEVLTQGLTLRPSAWALRATRPAAIRTDGFEVLVHEVMAAMTTSPSPTVNFSPSTATRSASVARPKTSARAVWNDGAATVSSTRSCGRLGPASDGTTVEMSSSRTSVKTGSSEVSSIHRPWALA